MGVPPARERTHLAAGACTRRSAADRGAGVALVFASSSSSSSSSSNSVARRVPAMSLTPGVRDDTHALHTPRFFRPYFVLYSTTPTHSSSRVVARTTCVVVVAAAAAPATDEGGAIATAAAVLATVAVPTGTASRGADAMLNWRGSSGGTNSSRYASGRRTLANSRSTSA